jgi:hypothetical protein
MGHFRIVFMEAQQHQQQSFIDKEGVVFALPVLLCTALKKTSTYYSTQVPGQAASQACSMQYVPTPNLLSSCENTDFSEST